MPNRIKAVGITIKMDKLKLTKKHKRDQRTALKVAGSNKIAPNGHMDIFFCAKIGAKFVNDAKMLPRMSTADK